MSRRTWNRDAAPEPIAISDSLGGVVRSLRTPETAASTSATPAGSAASSLAALGGVFGRWTEAVGDAVAQHVQPVKLDGTRLAVEVDDPAWATQLRFLEATVIRRLREVAGAEITVLDIRVKRR